MKILSTNIPGCFEISPNIFKDHRGELIKIFHQEIFAQHGLETDFVEDYYSFSSRNVLRGLHFQIPPKDHTKLVACVMGEVVNVVVDLRVNSPVYGKFEIFRLSDEKANMAYVPRGLAHGFHVISETAIVLCKLSTVYSPEHDQGILWNSVDVPWPNINFILSEKDKKLPCLADFASPFLFK